MMSLYFQYGHNNYTLWGPSSRPITLVNMSSPALAAPIESRTNDYGRARARARGSGLGVLTVHSVIQEGWLGPGLGLELGLELGLGQGPGPGPGPG